MLRSLLGFLCACSIACAAEEGDPTPTVVGKSAEAAADIATNAVCEYADRCGTITVTCADCAQGQDCPGCFAELVAVTYDACTMDVGEDFANGFACEGITDEEAARVDACLQALADRECPTVEEAEAWADGGPGEDPRQPEVCDTLEDIRWRCFEQGEPEEMMPSPG